MSPLRIYLVQEAASVDIPHLDAPPPITRKYLSLVRMKGDGVDGMAGVKGTGVISSLFTCESGWRMILEHMPDGASQNRILWSYPAVARMTLITLAAGSCK